MAPKAGVNAPIVGAGTTVNVAPLLVAPFTVTVTGPVVAVVGTTAVIVPPLQPVTEAVVRPNWTILVPCVDPKFAPAIVTA